ncbi:GTPase Era [Clostridia bacterium]|nr:GTPase Era [Clostridia bacterium]
MNLGNFKSGFVAIVGRPNVGKSTLMNQILKQKIAIMSEKPHTTRNRITGVHTTSSMQAIFLDTPGIHKPKNKLGEYMVDTALNTLQGVDVVVYVIDATMKLGAGEEFIMAQLKKSGTKTLLAINKTDLVTREALLPIIALYSQKMEFTGVVPLSAKNGDNVVGLLEEIENILPEGPKYYPEEMVTDQPERLIVAEMIREKVLMATREEVPHSVAVQTDLIKERSEQMIYVAATIFVERKSQKGIIIGKNGANLKEIGRLARQDIQVLLGSKIYLELWVKVKEQWRRSEMDIKNFGFTRD